ncbi:MAG: hypothetical protein ACI8P3_003202 [Saprospiraceae bacterium]|jgi:hypothetical protein
MKLLFTYVLIPCCLLLSTSNMEIKQEYDLDWKLKKEENGIKVFTRGIANSNLKELKINLTLESTSLFKVLDVLNNVSSYKDWVFKCIESREISVLNEKEIVSYYKFDFPWPLSDRDIYMKAHTEITPDHKSAVITTSVLPTYGDKEEGVVRVEDHLNSWELHEIGDQVELTYYLKSNPGGKIPDWVVNLAIDTGPTNTLTNLRGLIQQ